MLYIDALKHVFKKKDFQTLISSSLQHFTVLRNVKVNVVFQDLLWLSADYWQITVK